MKRFLVPAVLAALAGAAGAQVTHFVSVGPGFAFVPDDITIQVGDTVQWDWAGPLFHNVESGTGGVPDGNFSSGAPVPGPNSFSVTFDAAFLTANPEPGNVYDYFCAVHVTFGMEGVVRVIAPYGCVNPAGSLVVLGGQPKVGDNWILGVDNPIPGGQTPGATQAFLGIAVNPAPGFPCGIPLPGYHMDPVQPFGELLINIVAPDPILILGPSQWPGPGSPAPHLIPIPPTPALVGLELHTQGLMLDPVGPNTFGASEGLRTTIGS